MKVLLIGFAKIAYMPYMHFYLNELAGHEVDLIYWDRDGKEDVPVPESIAHAYKFEAALEQEVPLWQKMPFFWKFRRFALRILHSKEYDRVVLLHTVQGLTLIDYLVRKYRGRYVLDFRDVSYEHVSVYRNLVRILADNAAYVYVSSDAFRKFLPTGIEIHTIHNYLKDALEHRDSHPQERHAERLVMSFWGFVRQVEINKRLMDAVGNDPRFELRYYGRLEQDGRAMQAYAADKGYSNISFFGSYMPDDRYLFGKTTQIIDNIYDTDQTTGNAMGNKYYDGILFRIPQICTKGSFMGDIVTARGVGLAIDFERRDVSDQIWDYYSHIDWQKFERNCDLALEQVLDQQHKAIERFHRFLEL